jgi:Phospholipase_D-nuclease N-terminal
VAPAEIVAIVLPLVLIQLVLIVIAVRDVLRPEREVRGGRKGLWILVIVLGELLGPILYFTLGRENE